MKIFVGDNTKMLLNEALTCTEVLCSHLQMTIPQPFEYRVLGDRGMLKTVDREHPEGEWTIWPESDELSGNSPEIKYKLPKSPGETTKTIMDKTKGLFTEEDARTPETQKSHERLWHMISSQDMGY